MLASISQHAPPRMPPRPVSRGPQYCGIFPQSPLQVATQTERFFGSLRQLSGCIVKNCALLKTARPCAMLGFQRHRSQTITFRAATSDLCGVKVAVSGRCDWLGSDC